LDKMKISQWLKPILPKQKRCMVNSYQVKIQMASGKLVKSKTF